MLPRLYDVLLAKYVLHLHVKFFPFGVLMY